MGRLKVEVASELVPRQDGHRSTSNHQVTAGFRPCFHLPAFHFGYLFLTHSQTLQSTPGT